MDKTPNAEDVQDNNIVLSENDEQKCIEELRVLIKDCKSLNIRTDDYYLTKFLVCEDWDAKRTFQRLERWFKIKVDYPDWFYNKPLSAYEKIIKMNCKVLLEKPDKHGRLIYLTTFKNVSPSKTSATEMAQLDNFWFELAHLSPASHKNGIVCLIDFTGYSLRCLKWLSPGNMKIGNLKTVNQAVKKMEVHLFNYSSVMNIVVQMSFPFMTEEQKAITHFHKSDLTSLHKFVGTEALPEEYGGPKGQKIDYEKRYEELYANEEYFMENMKYGYVK